MITPIEFLQLKGFAMLLIFVQNMLVHFLLFQVQFIFMDIKVPLKKHIACAAIMALIYFLPMYVIDYLFYYPAFFSTSVYTLLIFDDPVSAIAYYFIMRWVFKFSSTRTSIMLRNQLLMHYIVVLIYLFLFNSLASIKGVTEISPSIYLQDVVTILIVMALLIVVAGLVMLVLKKTRKYIVIPPNYYEKNITLKVAGTICTIGVLYACIVLFRIEWLAANSAPLSFTTAFIYAMWIGILALFFFSTISGLRYKLLEWEMQATGTYISSLLHANQEFRGVKHDFYNVLQAYGGYLAIEDYEGLKRYHQTLFQTTRSAGDFLSLIEVLKSRIAVYSLFESKSQKAEELGVIFSINGVCDISNVILTDIDLCRALGIVLDNAIESAAVSQDKQVNISFETKSEDTVVFIISNTTSEDVDTQRIFEEGYSTKDGHSGIGLTQVMHIINSYEHCSYRASYHENQFSFFLITYARRA